MTQVTAALKRNHNMRLMMQVKAAAVVTVVVLCLLCLATALSLPLSTVAAEDDDGGKLQSQSPPAALLRDHPLFRDWFLTFPNAYVTDKVGWRTNSNPVIHEKEEGTQTKHQQQPPPMLVALRDIPIYEIVMVVPDGLLVSGQDLLVKERQQTRGEADAATDGRNDDDGDDRHYHHDDPDCALTDFLVDELNKGSASSYYPYLHHHVMAMAMVMAKNTTTTTAATSAALMANTTTTTTAATSAAPTEEERDGYHHFDDLLLPPWSTNPTTTGSRSRDRGNNRRRNNNNIIHPMESWSTPALDLLLELVKTDLAPDQRRIFAALHNNRHRTYATDCTGGGQNKRRRSGGNGDGGNGDGNSGNSSSSSSSSSSSLHELVYQDYVMGGCKLSIVDDAVREDEVWAPLVHDLVVWPHRHGKWQNLRAEVSRAASVGGSGGDEDNEDEDISKNNTNGGQGRRRRRVDVFAMRHIKAGEPLYLSVVGGTTAVTRDRDGRTVREVLEDEHNDDGLPNYSCYVNGETLEECITSQDVLAHYGIVENYPRQWLFEVDPPDDALRLLVEVDLVADDDDDDDDDDNDGSSPGVDGNTQRRRTLKWLYPHASSTEKQPHLTIEQIGWIYSIRDRLHRLRGVIQRGVEEKLFLLEGGAIEDDDPQWSPKGEDALSSRQQQRSRQLQHEGNVLLEYLDAYTEAVELAWTHRDVVGVPDETTEAEAAIFDPLDEPTGMHPYNIVGCYDPTDDSKRRRVEETSFHQYMEFSHNLVTGDTCLSQTEWIQVCTSFRPHYHEAIFHVVAQYVSNNTGVKRVAYLGGGDSMLLHEILKYPQLELVVGMELDQQVLRKSFTHFGSQPHFDDPRVEWWFGDASRTLLALPLDYYQSFDVVVVDLLTFIADALKVTPDMSVMDAAILLMKPDGGVLSKNEDFPVRANVGFTKYSVDLEYHNMPRICELSVTIASNSIDFIKAEPNQHEGVDSLILNLTVSPSRNKTEDETYHGWYSYRHTHPKCENIAETVADNTCSDASSASGLPKHAPVHVGVLVIVEAENIQRGSLDKLETVQSSIRQALESLALSEISAEIETNFLLFVLRQGYVALRTYPEANYVGFDIMLWDDLDQVNAIKNSLVSAVGGNWQQSTSSFRFVAGGMYGLEKNCPTKTLSSIATLSRKRMCEEDDHESTGKDHTSGVDSSISVIDAVPHLLAMFLPTHLTSPSTVVVLCGVEGTSCKMLNAVHDWARSSDRLLSVHAIYTCDSLSKSAPSLQQDMVACTHSVHTKLEAVVFSTKKIDGLLLDASVPRSAGQVVHKILADKKEFEALVEADSHFVLSPVHDRSEWQKQFVDRFRSDYVMFDPAHRADLHFEFSKEFGKDSVDSFTRYCLFRAGDADFFPHLMDAVADIEDKMKVSISVDQVTNGIVRYIPETSSWKIFRDTDYDKTVSRLQWLGQHPVGHQTLYKFIVRPPKEPLKIGERVLAEIQPGPWNVTFGEATIVNAVVEEDENGLAYRQAYTIEYMDKGIPRRTTTRESIRKFSIADSQADKSFKFGDLVLFRRSDTGIEGYYQNGMVFKTAPVAQGTALDSQTYSVYQLETDGIFYDGIPHSSMVVQFESAEYLQHAPQISAFDLAAALETALKNTVLADDETLMVKPPVTVGMGATIIAHWGGGTAIMKWDGNAGVEINLFTLKDDLDNGRVAFQDAFLGPNAKYFLEILSRDCFPRGYGKVVNFATDRKENLPHWL